jgi:isoleucyl-tRNA synthetase
VLSFTSDEVWQFMPGDREESVHLAEFPALHPEWLDDALVARWERIIKVRSDVSKALELARVAKTIGHSLDAAVAIAAPPELYAFLQTYAAELNSIFIVSKATLTPDMEGEYWTSENLEGLKIQVTAAPGVKCERCWYYSEELGSDAGHPTICPKCTVAVA